MAIPDYMLPEEGETAEQTQERLFREFIYARGGNSQALVDRMLAEIGPVGLASMYIEMWGELADDEEDYIDATDADIADPDVELFEDDE